MNIVWLKRDIRIQDHRPIYESLNTNNEICFIYIFEPIIENNFDFDYRHWNFIYQSLNDLSQKTKVSVFYGEALEVFNTIIGSYHVENVFSYQETGVQLTFDRDKEVKKLFIKKNINWKEFEKNGVQRGIKKRKDWSSIWYKKINAPILKNDLSLINKKNKLINIDKYALPEKVKRKITKKSFYIKGGEDQALEILDSFINNKINLYSRNISFAQKSRETNSILSSYIAWGNISLKQIYQIVKSNSDKVKNKRSLNQFLSRIRWNAHFIQKFEMEMRYENENINSAFDSIRNEHSKKLHDAWTNGNTGFPLVDAAMRCVKETGYLNFRLRAMVVSFYTHILWQNWVPASVHLAKMFLDYTPGIHFPQIQMQSGTTGVNTIRIYNPIKQSQEKDKDGIFIMKWVPELKNIPISFIHEPWKMTQMEQLLNNFQIGIDYPEPIVDFKSSYNHAKKELWRVKKSKESRKQNQIIVNKIL